MEHTKNKRNGGILLWLLPILILSGFATLIYFTQFAGGPDKAENKLHKSITDVRENNALIWEYVQFVNNHLGRTKPGQVYSSQALVKLVTATSAAAHFAHVDQAGELKKARAYANRITRDLSGTNHARYFRKSADLISGALYKVQQTAYPELANEVSAVKIAASQIDVNVEKFHQEDEVNNFFTKAADLLEKMN